MDAALARLEAEIGSLKETVVALRARLEQQAFAFEERLDAERSESRDERKHLQGTIAALRDALEAGPGAAARKI